MYVLSSTFWYQQGSHELFLILLTFSHVLPFDSMLGCTFKEATSTGQVLQQHSFAATFFDPTFIRSSPAQPNRVNREGTS